jgi:hypothetical protein
LFLSKDPISSIRAQVGLAGGYKECNHDQLMANNLVKQCAEGYIMDQTNLICYKVLNVIGNEETGSSVCEKNNGALIQLVNEKFVDGFVELLKTGTHNMHNLMYS